MIAIDGMSRAWVWGMDMMKLIAVAEKHVTSGPMPSSAKLALDEAKALVAEGQCEFARRRALRSLAYSVGIFHPDYLDASR
jgi:hypothetical protein